MKKILFLLLMSVSIYGQTYQNPTFGTVTTKTSPTVTNDPYLTTTGATGVQGKIAPVNVLIPYTPINYTISGQTIGQQIAAIDAKIGTMGTTSAGVTQRVYFTADNTVVNSVTYFASSLSGKGSTASGSPPALVLADNTKAYFTKDVISIAQPAPTIGYSGTYSGNLTVSASPTPVATQQRFTVEIYRTDNLGVPIASGVSGAPVGDLGVTVLAILDSGIINLTAGAITNIAVSGVLTQNITLNTGERLRYHVSAAKIGTGGGNVTFGVYYGTSYNSYYDVPVAITTDAVLNKSAVSGAITTTDALNNINSKIPVIYSKVVYVNNVNPNSATIFDLNNPPTVNDNALKADVNNLYIGTDASTWVYNSTSLNYVTKVVTSATSNFYFESTTTDAGNSKTANISRTGLISLINAGAGPIFKLNSNTGSTGNLFQTLKNGFVTSSFDQNGMYRYFPNGSMPYSSIPLNGVGIGARGGGINAMIANRTNNTTSSGLNITSLQTLDVARTIEADIIFRTGFDSGADSVSFLTTNGIAYAFQNSSTNLFTISRQGVLNITTIPSTSSGVFNPITRNQTNGNLEVLPSNYYALNLLTGYVSGAGTVSATDTVLQAIQKLNGNTSLKSDTASPTFTGDPKAPTPTAGDNDTSIATTAFVANALSSGSYTPTLTATANCSALTLTSAFYQKVGNIVSVSVLARGTTTSANAITSFTATLPINKATITAIQNGSFNLGFSANSDIAMGYCSVGQTTVSCTSSTINSSGSNAYFIINFSYDVTQ